MPFLVLEGLDGAGKSTQIKQITNMLDERGIKHEYIHFPRFETPVYGDLVARFLRGELGTADTVNPYLVALIYAGDRAEAANTINQWIAQGRWVIIDRYVCSNIAYQCAKEQDDAKRNALRDWILDVEYSFNKIPQPDVTLFLDVPFEFTERKLTEERTGDDRDYLNGKSDIHEASLSLQRAVREVYLAEAQQNERMWVVECGDKEGAMLAPEKIFEKIRVHIEKLL